MIYLDTESEFYLLEETLEIKSKQIYYFENKIKKFIKIEKNTFFIFNALPPRIRIFLLLYFIISIKSTKFNYNISSFQDKKIDNITFIAAIKDNKNNSKKDLIQKINKLFLKKQLDVFFEIQLKIMQINKSNFFETNNKSILYQYFISYCRDKNLEMNLKNFKKYIFTKSNILGNFFYIDEFILKNRQDVLNYCVQKNFSFEKYESWILNYGLNEYGLNFLKNEYLKLSRKSNSSPTVQFNSLHHEHNGLQSIVKIVKNSISDLTKSKKDIVICVGGALEYNQIYPLKIYKKNISYKIAVCVWELDSIPDFLNDKFIEFDEIWVLSKFSAKAFKKIGKKTRVLKYHFNEINLIKIKKADEIKYFLVIFDFASDFHRKNPLMAINAFKAAAKSFKDIKLIVKCINAEKDLKNFKKIKIACSQNANIKIINQILSKKQLNELINKSLGIISLHRAEGLGLNIIDGVLLKKPIVLSNYSAPVEYMPANYKYWVNGTVVKTAQNSGAYGFENLNWFEPNIDDAIKKIKEIIMDGPDSDMLLYTHNYMIRHFSNKAGILRNLLSK